ncbi:ribokinase [Edaphobacter modestus]|uniref:Ribokinase n=1 Tax=Edaphobacter modestus TaxID=388466 RepID=A0A4Q7YQR3_9BACT|nr:ribokinase [Edaphobacter modestus]RZU40007.1 ribokinase [Edaphobacter modestus]
MNKRPIVVLGSANADLVARSSRLPTPGETVHGDLFAIHPGGKGANQAVAIARLDFPVEFLTVFGNDDFAGMLRSSLEDAGVDISFAETQEITSGVALINIDANASNQIVVIPGANARVDETYVRKHRNRIESAAVLLLQLEIPISAVACAAEIAHNAGVPVILDPAPACALPPELLRCVSWLTPNQTEAKLLSKTRAAPSDLNELNSMDQIFSDAQELQDLGVQNVVLKLGDQGVVLKEANGAVTHLPAARVDAIDTTAAGDAFNGAFAMGLASGMATMEAARWAVAAASISVTKAGAQPSLPTLEEVKAFLIIHRS